MIDSYPLYWGPTAPFTHTNAATEPICHKADSVSCLAAPPPNGIMAHSLHFARSTALNFVLVAQGALDMFWWVSSVLFFSVLIPLTDFLVIAGFL